MQLIAYRIRCSRPNVPLRRRASEKFVPQPERDDVITDAISGLRRFKETVRWREYFRLKKIEDAKKTRERLGLPAIVETSEEESIHSEDEAVIEEEDTLTNLRQRRVNMTAPKGTDNTETFLKKVEEEVLERDGLSI